MDLQPKFTRLVDVIGIDLNFILKRGMGIHHPHCRQDEQETISVGVVHRKENLQSQ
jgi:hypothetical protein